MPRGPSDRDRDRDRSRRSPKEATRRIKRKPCAFCRDQVEWIDYKDIGLLRKFMSDRGKIRSRRVTGNCAQHQRDVAIAIKTARELVLLPYTQRTVSDRTRPPARAGSGMGRDLRVGDDPDALLDSVLEFELDLEEDLEELSSDLMADMEPLRRLGDAGDTDPGGA